MSDLRAHSQPCDHSELVRFVTGYPQVWQCRAADCPGGRKVTIDYDAAGGEIEWWISQFVQDGDNKAAAYSAGVDAIAAATGDIDVTC